MHGDDFTFAGTESELRKIEANMHEWYDVKVRGILGSGKRDVQEIEILGRNLTWTEEGLEYEGSDKHRWSRRGHGYAGRVGSEEIQKFGGDAKLFELGQVRCTIRREGSM